MPHTKVRLLLILIISLIFSTQVILVLISQYKTDNTRLTPDHKITAPSSNIVYIKTHKTGSSTLAQILYRYGLNHGLYFAQYPDRIMLDGEINVTDLIPLPPTQQHYNLIAQHFTYNKQTVDNLFGDNKVVLTILRHPVERFCSALNFLGLPKELLARTGHALVGLDLDVKVTKLFQFLNGIDGRQADEIMYRYRMLFNDMSRDFGLPEEKLNPRYGISETEIGGFIEFLDSNIDLVLIQEYFDQSMLVLAETLKITPSEVLYIRENSKVGSKTISYSSQLSESTIKMIQDYNYIDLKLYSHFLRKFQEKYISGELLSFFKSNLDRKYSTCVCGSDYKGLFGTVSYRLCEDQIDNRVCRELLTDSLTLTYIVSTKQLAERGMKKRKMQSIENNIKNKNLLSADDF